MPLNPKLQSLNHHMNNNSDQNRTWCSVIHKELVKNCYPPKDLQLDESILTEDELALTEHPMENKQEIPHL